MKSLHISSETAHSAPTGFTLRVLRAIRRVAEHPLSSQAVEQRPEIRRVPLVRYPYIIYYEVGATEVTILRILHGARLQPWE